MDTVHEPLQNNDDGESKDWMIVEEKKETESNLAKIGLKEIDLSK
jgi:hypothetical protein